MIKRRADHPALDDTWTRHRGRFSSGMEQLPETDRKIRVGRFSDGVEGTNLAPEKLRPGSFADGYEASRRRGVAALGH
jgi:hypothetical protein